MPVAMTPAIQNKILSLKTLTKPTNSISRSYRVEIEGQTILLQGKKGFTTEEVLAELEQNFKEYQ